VGGGATVATWGDATPSDAGSVVAAAPTPSSGTESRIAVGSGLELVLRGRSLEASDQSLLTAYAAHFAVLEERRRARADAERTQELAEGNRTKTALLAAVSHDLRTPLAAIKAASSSLRNTAIAWSDEDREELLATVEESADRLDALVANLLDMSRLQTGSITSLSTEVDLASVAEWTLRSIPGAERIAVTAPDELPPVTADPGLLERVIANVVENALKHTDAVAVSVSAWTSGESGARVSLRVVDRGPGVPVESLEAIFEPFQRVGDVPAGDGVGLGLAVARGLMEAMGGTLAAEETPGGGLTLVIDLPAVAGEHR
jgi:two-component system sensor histidine kinase KdpD